MIISYLRIYNLVSLKLFIIFGPSDLRIMMSTITRRQQQPINLYLIIYNNEKMKIPPGRMPQIFTKQFYKYQTMRMYLRKWNYRVEFSFQSKDRRQEAIDEIRKFKGKHGVKCYYYWQKGPCSYYLMQEWEYRNAITFNLNDFQSPEMDIEQQQERLRLGLGLQKSQKVADLVNNQRDGEKENEKEIIEGGLELQKQQTIRNREQQESKEERGEKVKQQIQREEKKAKGSNVRLRDPEKQGVQKESLELMRKKEEEENQINPLQNINLNVPTQMEEEQLAPQQKQREIPNCEKSSSVNKDRVDMQEQEDKLKEEQEQGNKQKKEKQFSQEANNGIAKKIVEANQAQSRNLVHTLPLTTQNQQRIVTRRSARGKNAQNKKASANKEKQKVEENQSAADKNKTKNISKGKKNTTAKNFGLTQISEEDTQKKITKIKPDIKFGSQKKEQSDNGQIENKRQGQKAANSSEIKASKVNKNMDLDENRLESKELWVLLSNKSLMRRLLELEMSLLNNGVE